MGFQAVDERTDVAAEKLDLDLVDRQGSRLGHELQIFLILEAAAGGTLSIWQHPYSISDLHI